MTDTLLPPSSTTAHQTSAHQTGAHQPTAWPLPSPEPCSGVSPVGGWSLAGPPLLRINPLAGRRLGSTPLRAALTALFAADQHRAALRDAACEELFALAGAADGRDRARVLKLKRAVYNGRDPGPVDWLAPIPPSVSAWLFAHERSTLARATIETGYGVFMTEERELLAELLAGEPFLQSLALTSPQVLDAAERYRRSPGFPNTRDRKSERGLVQHLTRAMVRVSPLSRFTAVGFGMWSEAGVGLDEVRFDRRRARSVLTPDRALLFGMVNGIVAAPTGAAPPTLVQRNPRLRVEGTQIRFLHVLDGRRRALAAQANAGVMAVLHLTAMGPVPVSVLEDEIARRLALSAHDAAELVRSAYQAQLLVDGPVVYPQAVDPLASAALALDGFAPDAAAQARVMHDALTQAATGSVEARVAALRRVRAAEERLNAASAYPAQVRINEDYLLDPIAISASGYEAALTDLSAVAAISNLFDRHHDMRALLHRAFLDRFGPGASVSLIGHADELVAEVRNRSARLTAETADDLGPDDGSLAELVARREEVSAQISAEINAAAAAGLPEVRLDPHWVTALAGLTPPRFAELPASYAVLVQPENGRLIVNGCYPGHGQILSRFVGHDDSGDATARALRRRIEALYGRAGTRLVEDRGLHGNNLNHRRQVLPATIGASEWLGVELRHDPATDRLTLIDANGIPMTVVTLGMKWIEAQPSPLLLAAWLYGTSMVAYDPIGRAHAAARRAQTELGTIDPGATVPFPRVVVGEVVLQRRRWYPGLDLATAFDESDTRSDLLAVTRWRSAHDVPEEVFIKTPLWRMPDSDEVNADEQIKSYVIGRRREKPQYVDLASALMVRVLPKLMERRQSGYIEEALPRVRTAVHAREWAVELDRRP